MYETKEEISKNKYINNLVSDAESFNIFGKYVWFSTAKKPQNNGFYFVCGYDKDKISKNNFDIEKEYAEQCSSKGIRVDLHIAKITNQSPFAVQQQVLEYCLHASTFRAICNMFCCENDFTVVSQDFISNLERLYLHSADTEYLSGQRETIRKYLCKVGKPESLLNGKGLGGPKVQLRPEKLDTKCPNMVSLKDLIYKTIGTEQITITKNELLQIKKELNKHSEILYFQTKPVVTRLHLPKKVGYVKRTKTFSSVTIIYDAFYKKQMDLIYLKAIHPECFRYSVADLREKYGDICSFGIYGDSIESVFEDAISAKIPICIDEEKLYFSYDTKETPSKNIAGYTVTIPKSYINDMDNVLFNRVDIMRKTRILTEQDEKNFSF